MTNISTHSIVIAAVAGLLAGMHAAIWGMYKDGLYEGFTTDRFLGSVVLGAMCGVSVHVLLRLPLPDMGSFVVLFGLAYATERGLVEVWKTFLREEDQAKYTIPTRLTVRGVPVESRLVRLLAGIAYVARQARALSRRGSPASAVRASARGHLGAGGDRGGAGVGYHHAGIATGGVPNSESPDEVSVTQSEASVISP